MSRRRASFYPLFVEPAPAVPHSPIRNGRASRPPAKSALRAPRYKVCQVKMQQQLESSKGVSTMSMDMDLDLGDRSESETAELFGDDDGSLCCARDDAEDCADANACGGHAASLCHDCGAGDFGNDASAVDGDDERRDLVEAVEKESIPKTMHEVEEMQMGKMQDGKVPSKPQATTSKMDAVPENRQKQKEEGGGESQARGHTRRRRGKDRDNAGAEDPSLTSSSNCNADRRGQEQVQEQLRAEKSEDFQHRREESGTPRVRSTTPQRGKTKSQDRAAGRGNERACPSSSLSTPEDLQDAAQVSRGVRRPFLSSSDHADQNPPARFNLEEFTTCVVISSEDAKDQDQQQSLPPQQSGQNSGMASTPASSSPNTAGQSQDQVQADLIKWISTHCHAGDYSGYPLPPLQQRPETHRAFGNGLDQSQAGFIPGEYPLLSQGRQEGLNRSIPSSSFADHDEHSKGHSLSEQPGQKQTDSSVIIRHHDHPPSARAHEEGTTRSGQSMATSQCAAASVSKCEESDYENHPLPAQTQASGTARPVHLRTSSHHNADGTAAAPDRQAEALLAEASNWFDDISTLTHTSPLPKISGAVQPVYQYDAKGRCVHHPHIQLRKKKLLGRGWKVIMTACPDCCVEELRRIQFAEEENIWKEARETRKKDGTTKKKSPRRKGRNKEARDGKHESDGKRVGRDKGRRKSSRGKDNPPQSSAHSTGGHNKSNAPKIEQIALRAPTPPPRRRTSRKSRDASDSFANAKAVESTKRSPSRGLQRSLDKMKPASRRRCDETASLTESSLSNEMLCDANDSHGNQKQSQSIVSKRDVKISRRTSAPPLPRRPSISRSGRTPHDDLVVRHTAVITTANAVKRSSPGSNDGDIDDRHGNCQGPQSSLNRAAVTNKKQKSKRPMTPPPPPRPPRRSKSQEILRQAYVASNVDTLANDKGLERMSSANGSSRKSSIESIDDGKQTYQRQKSSVGMDFAAAVMAPPRKPHPQDSAGDISTLVNLNALQHLCDEVALLSERLQRLSKEGIDNSQIHHRRQPSFDSMGSNGSCNTTNKTVIPPPPPRRRITIPQDTGPYEEMTSLKRSSRGSRDQQIDNSSRSHQHCSSTSSNGSSNNTSNSTAPSPTPPPRRSQSLGPRGSHIFEQFQVIGGRIHAINARYDDSKGRSGIYSGEVSDHFLPHGKGTMAYDSGVVKQGEWKNGLFRKSKTKESVESKN